MPTDLYAELIYLISTDSKKKKKRKEIFFTFFVGMFCGKFQGKKQTLFKLYLSS